MTMFEMSPSEIRASVISCMEVGLVPYIEGSPGISKSAVVAQIAKDYKLDVIDVRMSQATPEDFMGLPMRNKSDKASFMPFDTYPIQSDTVPEGKNGWLLFLDEFNAGNKAVQAASYKVVLDRYIGQHKLHDSVYCVAAGNLATDRAITNALSTAMQSRLIHLRMAVSHPDFMAHAVKEGFDYRILGFLEFQPSKLHTFKPDHSDRTFACPRTWEFASRLIKGKDSKQISTGLLAGTISDGVAVEFKNFMDVFADLPSYSSIRSNPQTISVPTDSGTRFAIVTMMLDKFTEDSFEEIMPYILRMPPEFQVIYMRGVVARHPKMRANKVYSKNSLHLLRFLEDDPAPSANDTLAA